MRVITLVENTSCKSACKAKHGLSLYIETTSHKLLFDVGPDETFIHNAKELDVKLEDVDTVIISHGHKDHGGGLKAFFDINDKADVFIQQDAFEKYYMSVLGAVKVNVGLDMRLKENARVKCLDGNSAINETMRVFTNPRINVLKSKSNHNLYKKTGKGYEKDDFLHEQSLLIQEANNTILIAGCAHRGITNIINEAELITKGQLNTVIGGFHLMNPVGLSRKADVVTSAIGEVLQTKDTKYYTCHCTGEEAYLKLKEILGEQIGYLATGSTLEI